jgi:hypothetical protein
LVSTINSDYCTVRNWGVPLIPPKIDEKHKIVKHVEMHINLRKIALVTRESFRACFRLPFLTLPNQLQEALASSVNTLSQQRITTFAVEVPPIVRMKRTFKNNFKNKC